MWYNTGCRQPLFNLPPSFLRQAGVASLLSCYSTFFCQPVSIVETTGFSNFLPHFQLKNEGIKIFSFFSYFCFLLLYPCYLPISSCRDYPFGFHGISRDMPFSLLFLKRCKTLHNLQKRYEIWIKRYRNRVEII
jgi:hypothetical protein